MGQALWWVWHGSDVVVGVAWSGPAVGGAVTSS